MLFQITVFTVLISTSYCQDECVTYEKCLDSVEETNQTFTSSIIYYWQERLTLDEEITDSLKKQIASLNEDIKSGSTRCQDFILIETPGRYSDIVQMQCYNDTYEAYPPPEEVEKYFSGKYVGSLENFCTIYVEYLNAYCGYLASGIKQTRGCDSSKIFEEMFRNPWEECIYYDNNSLN